MGEFADMAIEDSLFVGHMWDVYGEEYEEEGSVWLGRTRRRPTKTCGFCKAKGLRWGVDPETDRYVLEDPHGTRHVCKMNRIGKSSR